MDESRECELKMSEASLSSATSPNILVSSISPARRVEVVDLDEGQPAGTSSQLVLEFVRRSKRARKPSVILQLYEVTSDPVIITDGEFTHFALLAELEQVSDEEALSDSRWRSAMEEELKAIKKRTRPGRSRAGTVKGETSNITLHGTKRILRYIKETIELGLMYPTNLNGYEAKLVGFIDADSCGDKDDRKNTTDYMFMINNSPISWCSKSKE
ncbi:uncharacterized protein [Cicer arietinum]|uniref:Uncharacterized protein LOC105851286 n=1 Tax=Cicer arietinum TaxID=3827 RepID=A0A1S3DVC7_CICAR|nr:uncharacterized protein LOC105851286 [Cicer arietinum]